MGKTKATQQARVIVQDKGNSQNMQRQARETAGVIVQGKVDSPGQVQMHKSKAKGQDKM